MDDRGIGRWKIVRVRFTITKLFPKRLGFRRMGRISCPCTTRQGARRVFVRRSTVNIQQDNDKPMPKKWSKPPELTIDTNKAHHATIKTNRGTIRLELYPQHAPRTVNNFVFLAGEGFYDGVTFHRVINNFMIQGGDPEGTGRGGPGYTFEDELESNPLRHDTGVISMANAGPNTNGSQFFTTHAPQPHLDGRHTVFGRVVEGQDVVDAVKQGDTIESIEIES